MVNTSDGKILCIIPARGGSKGVKKKNIRQFNGKPLIAWTIEEASKSKFLDRIIVSTEDAEIEEISLHYGAEVIKRPWEFARDTSPSIDAILYTLDFLKIKGYTPDYIVLLQCTSPLRNVKHIDEAIELFLEHNDIADSLISVTKEEHPPWWLKKADTNGLLSDFMEYDKSKYTRRQDFPDIYRQNGAICISKIPNIYKLRDFDTGSVLPYIMDPVSSIDIDTEIDFLVAELLSKR